jgi:hypothetical protein
MEQVKKMIESYNKKAQKWRFEKIEVINGKISKEFSEKTTNGKGFFGKIKVIYQNGYMKEDYEKIKNALSEIKFEEPKTDNTIVEDGALTLFKKTIKYDKTIEEEALKNTFKY